MPASSGFAPRSLFFCTDFCQCLKRWYAHRPYPSVSAPRDAGKSNALGTTPPMRLNQLPSGGTRTHEQDENDTRSMAALCQSLLRLRDASKAALIVVHHVRKSIGRDEIGRTFRGSSALHAVGDSYLLLARPSAETRQ